MDNNTNLQKTGYLTESKVSKSRNGKSQSYTYSTVIPKPIVNKFGLDKGQKLYWDINELSIVITPELPEDKSIQAGLDILNDFIVNGNNHYGTYSTGILSKLQQDKPKEEIIEELVHDYKMENRDEYQEYYTKVVTYLLDYPTTPENNEILREVYNQITQTD